jgi:hypothetical protein
LRREIGQNQGEKKRLRDALDEAEAQLEEIEVRDIVLDEEEAQLEEIEVGDILVYAFSIRLIEY